MLEKEGRLPDVVMACVGGGSNAIGAFSTTSSGMRGRAPDRLRGCGPRCQHRRDRRDHRYRPSGHLPRHEELFCQDEYGQSAPVYSISAGLDYPGIGPSTLYLHDIGRAEYVPVTGRRSGKRIRVSQPYRGGIIPGHRVLHTLSRTR